jgi:hypothetical protein
VAIPEVATATQVDKPFLAHESIQAAAVIPADQPIPVRESIPEAVVVITADQPIPVHVSILEVLVATMGVADTTVEKVTMVDTAITVAVDTTADVDSMAVDMATSVGEASI